MKKQLLLILLSLFLFSCEKEELNMSEVEQEEVEQEEIKLEVLSPMVNWLGSLRISSDKVMLEWYAADTNSIAFELEKKVGTADFQVIARLDTADVGKFVTTYNFTDSNPQKYVTTYYRVRSFSANDTSEYSTSPPLVVGELIKTSDYNFGRFYSELTKLGNGEVLMIGGRQHPQIKYVVERFTPSAGSWATGAAMLQERTSHRAVTLRNGKVLVSGGTINDKHFSSTELYDPVTNTFSEGADMKYPHSSHTITKLKDGNVLVVAGYRSNARFSDKCEIYYPDKDEWQEIAPLNTARAGHSTFQLGNGDILVIGGVSTDIEGHPIVSCELYSFSSNTWTEVGQLLTRREGFTAFAVDEDNILLAGGGFWDANTKVELFNTRTFTSLRQPNTLYDYQWAEALDLENGLVLLHGHSFYNYSDGSRINSQVYNKKTKEWMLTNYLPFEKKSIYNIGSSGLLLEANKAILVSDNKESVIFNLKLE